MGVSNGCGLVINLSESMISSIFKRWGSIGKAVVVFRVSTNCVNEVGG